MLYESCGLSREPLEPLPASHGCSQPVLGPKLADSHQASMRQVLPQTFLSPGAFPRGPVGTAGSASTRCTMEIGFQPIPTVESRENAEKPPAHHT